MARFPTTEPELVALAQATIAGLSGNTSVFPSPPIAPADLSARLSAFLSAQSAATTADAAAQQAHLTKDDAQQDLADDLRAVLRYAELTTGFDDARLKLLGWGGRAARTSLEPPGQCRVLEAPRQGEGWLFLDWKEPSDGGRIAAYKVQRRERGGSAWQDTATAIQSEITLVEQPRGAELEYRVIAVNKAGEGPPSNTVQVVL